MRNLRSVYLLLLSSKVFFIKKVRKRENVWIFWGATPKSHYADYAEVKKRCKTFIMGGDEPR
jgi:hypothetical protein